jgi:hypothetical protein
MTKKLGARRRQGAKKRHRVRLPIILVFFAEPGHDLEPIWPEETLSASAEMLYRTVRICAANFWDGLGRSQRRGHISIEVGTSYARAAVPADVEHRVKQELTEHIVRVVAGETGSEELRIRGPGGECRFRVWFRASPLARSTTREHSEDAQGGNEPAQFEELLSPRAPQQPKDSQVACDKMVNDLVLEHQAFWENVVRRFEPALNTYIREQAPETFEQKKALAEQVSDYLSRLGLAIRYENQSCDLFATRGDANRLGRFLLKPKGSGKALITRANVVDLLPFELTGGPTRREALTEWRERVSRGKDISTGRTK